MLRNLGLDDDNVVLRVRTLFKMVFASTPWYNAHHSRVSLNAQMHLLKTSAFSSIMSVYRSGSGKKILKLELVARM